MRLIKLLLYSILTTIVLYSEYSAAVPKKSTNVLNLSTVSVDVYKVGAFRHGYWGEDEAKFTNGANFNLGLQLFKYLDWKNKIHMLGTSSQIRHCGWEWELKVNIFDQIQPFYYHHSMHTLERERDTGTYPLENYVGVKFIFRRD